jgi:hypothetical protein
LVADFGDLPVFQSTSAYPCIFVWKKAPRHNIATTWAVIQNLEDCFTEGITEHVSRIAQLLPATQFGKGKARLMSPATANLSDQMKHNTTTLGEYVEKRIYFGIKTGLNEAFIIDQKIYDRMINADPESKKVIKPLLAGDDIRRYEIHTRDSYLIYTNHGIDISKYPVVENHLKPFRKRLEQRATKQGWYELQQPQSNFVPAFIQDKIIYPQISNEARFFLDEEKYYPLKTVYSISSDNWFLLGVLNSAPVMKLIQESFTKLRGGYFEFYTDKIEKLPVPNTSQEERNSVAQLAKQVQRLHIQRRKRVEKFLHDIGIDPAESTSRNPLESPWLLSEEEFTRRTRTQSVKVFKSAREETISVTEDILKVEKEIDARVKSLYGVD